VRTLKPFIAGGATDVIARSLGNFLSLAIKQAVNVEPKPGADGALAAQELLRQPADGHTQDVDQTVVRPGPGAPFPVHGPLFPVR
jgi:tripartite-type tricarboxylate transporter receptor subunit TctC